MHDGSSASWAGNLPFCGNLLPQKPKIGPIGHHQKVLRTEYIVTPTVNVTLQMRRPWNIARRVDVGRHMWIYGRPRRVCLLVCTVTDFSAEDKASGVKYCTVMVHRHPGQSISHFGELCSTRSSPKSPQSDHARWPARWPARRPARVPRGRGPCARRFVQRAGHA